MRCWSFCILPNLWIFTGKKLFVYNMLIICSSLAHYGPYQQFCPGDLSS